MVPKLALDFSTLIFGPHFFNFFAFSSLGCVPEGSRTDSGGSGDPPGPDFDRILRYFFAGRLRFCQGLSGSARVLPGSAPTLSNPFAGFPWGTAIREAV